MKKLAPTAAHLTSQRIEHQVGCLSESRVTYVESKPEAEAVVGQRHPEHDALDSRASKIPQRQSVNAQRLVSQHRHSDDGQVVYRFG